MPDLPVDEAGDWLAACAAHGIATVLLAAPNSTPERLAPSRRRPRVRVLRLDVRRDGRRGELAEPARGGRGRVRPLTDPPLLVGVGIATPEQAARACAFADGVVVGTALVEPL